MIKTYGKVMYTYNSRTKRYKFTFVGWPILFKALQKEIGSKSRLNYIIVKTTPVSFEVYEFFLLELEYLLNNILHSEHVMEIIDVMTPANDLYNFIIKETWVSSRYNKNDKDVLDLNYIPQVMKFKPLQHQYKAFEKYEEVKRYADLRGFLMDAAVGAGKTYTSLALGEALHYNTIIVIAPKQVIRTVWYNSLTGDDRIYKTNQSVCMLAEEDYDGQRFILLHYEYIEKLLRDTRLLRRLKTISPYLIVDEFHNFNEIKSNRTQNLLSLVNKVDFKDISLLTGTPIKFDVKELVPALYILDRKFPPVVDIFNNFYGKYSSLGDRLIKYRFGLYRERIERDMSKLPDIFVEVKRVRLRKYDDYLLTTITNKVEEYKKARLEEIMDNYSYYEELYNELLLKAKTKYIKYTNTAPDKADKLYNEYKAKVIKIRKIADKNQLAQATSLLTYLKNFESNYIYPYLNNEDKKKFKDIISIIKYPQLKVMGEALGKIVLGTRIRCYQDLASALNYKSILDTTDKKGIVFTNYITVADIAVTKLKKEGFKPIGLYGSETVNLNIIVDKFKKDKKINPIVATYKSLSTGVPLTEANIIICLDLPFRMYIFEQAVARAHRLGQDQPVRVYIIKLDTGDEFNITDRDIFILNLSKMKVEAITDNKVPFDLPKSKLMENVEAKEDELIDEVTDIATAVLNIKEPMLLRWIKSIIKIK